MRILAAILLACAGSLFVSCSSPKPAPTAARRPDPARITQFYATAPHLAAGEKEMLCYGVENAKTVWVTPPRQELSAALSRCIEVTPSETTTYTLTAEGESGAAATSQVTVTLGPPRVKIVEVTVSALQVKPGDAVSLCYHVQFAKSVSIEPIHFRAGPASKGCAMVQPRQTTTYTVTATGPSGDRDEQPVTVKVQ